MLDVLTLRNTENRKRLDDIMRLMYERYGKTGIGYSEQDYKACAEEVSGLNLTEYFEKYVWGHNSYESLLHECSAYVGLSLETTPSSLSHEANFGFRKLGNRITAVYPNSPADRAGLAVSDVLLKVNDTEVRPDIKEIKAGETLFLTIKNLSGEKTIRIDQANQTQFSSYKLIASNLLKAFKE